jgi:hypothetical protein
MLCTLAVRGSVPTCEMLSLDARSHSVEGMCMAAEIMEADVVGNILDVACGDSERYSFEGPWPSTF